VDTKLLALIEKIQEVCPVPATAQRLVMACNREDAQLAEIAQIIAADAALTAELMKIANSSAFGMPRTVSTLEHAVAMLGLNEVRSMASAMAMLAAFRTQGETLLKLHDVPVLAGAIARAAAGQVGYRDRATAFLCGLLCEVGALACVAADGAGYVPLFKEADGDFQAREALEQARYGVTTREIGAELLRRNGLPEPVAVAVAWALGTPASSPLEPLTAFSRRAAPLLVQAGKRNEASSLAESLGALAQASGLALDGAAAAELCVQAAGVALSSLRQARGS
jgi:HD-like signal output (HDOD) protein